ncbi:thiol peroxidase [Secundilactobacillus kimchicus]|uniref:thiol peroxidase n=1 Tax=Secundilactobacillus kimchicus TaxID=528209 RepID=UPI0024A99D18|nr:thiol peroxidase [Secundilactobacillus kimchicus]
MKITFNGDPAELETTPPTVGEELPKFKVFDNQNQKVKRADLVGQPLLISVVPDINTSVCSTQTHKFNQQADHYPHATFVTISNNTVAEQEGWCAAEGVAHLQLLSDEELSFGYATGLYLPTVGLLARSIFVVDEAGVITYSEIVPEATHEPNYVAALEALEKLTDRVDA